MKRIYIKDVKPGERAMIAGWVKTIRKQKTMIFVILRDVTGSIQVSLSRELQKELVEQVLSITRESVVRFYGTIIKAPGAHLGGIEMIPDKMEIESVAEDIPISEDSGKDLKMDYRWIELRDEKERLIFTIRSFVEYKMREFFMSKGFIEIHTPKITSQCSEGGADVFKVDYYSQKAYLTQSPQFYKQMAMAAGFDKVFEIGPYYRAEKSFTARHAAEAVCIDFEVSHVTSHHELMDIEEEWILYVLKEVKKQYGKIIKDVFGKEVLIPEGRIPRIKLAEVFEIFEKEYGIKTDEADRLDLSPDQEKLICDYAKDKLKSELVFITDYPAESRAFYSKKIDGTFDSMSFDMLYRGWEMNSGAVREHRYEVLKSQIEEHGIDSSKMADYLEFFRYGVPSHGGIGLGIARFVSKLLDLPSIKESILLFRGPSRMKP